MDANTICQKARLAVGDAKHTTYSDYECLTALQSALDMLVTSCDEYFSPALIKTAELELEENRAELPEDFRSVVSVQNGNGLFLESDYETGPWHGEYRFENSQIVSPETPITLTYRYRPERLTALEDEIDVPEFFELPLARITAALLQGDFTQAQSVSDQTAQTTKVQRWENVLYRKLWGGYNPNA